MTKKEIVKQISERANLTQMRTKKIVQWTFDAIVETLIREGRIELRNFGVFEVKRRKARKARNPRTGTKVEVGPKNVVTFQPGKEMEEKVRQMRPVPERKRRARANRAAPAPTPAPVAEFDAEHLAGNGELVGHGSGTEAGAGEPGTRPRRVRRP